MIRPRLPCINSAIPPLTPWEITYSAFRQRSRLERLRNPLDRSSSVCEQPLVVAFHQLKATIEVRLNPAAPVMQSFRRHAAVIAEAAVDRGGIAIAETLNDHKQHGALTYPRA